jgi:hypothetical protein
MVLCVTVLLGVLAVVLDGGVLLAERQHAQATADAAALAAAADLFANWNTNAGVDKNGTAAKSATTTATANGYTSGNSTVTINIPPKSGDHVNTAGYAEVIVTYNQGRFFSSIWGQSTIPVSARAVARGVLVAGAANPNNSIGFLVLQKTGTSVTLTGTPPSLTVAKTFAVNSTSSPFSTSGNPSITAGSFVFGATKSEVDASAGKLTFLPASASKTYGTVTADPLSGLTAPDPTNLKPQSYAPGQATINPGKFTGVINIGNHTLAMNPGIYYLQPDGSGNAGISVGGNGALDGTSGVFIYVAPGTGTLTLFTQPNGSGTANVSLNPINAGTYKGISIWVDGWSGQTIVMGGTPGASIYGTIYAPSANLELHGTPNAITGSQVIVNAVTLKGNSSIGAGQGPQAGQSTGFQLVE